MDSNYLYSILNLYLKKETDNKRTILNIKRLIDEVEFNFNMNEHDDDKTTLVIPSDIYSNILVDFIHQYQNNLMVIDEKFNFYKEHNTCSYYVLFKNGRVISFDGFTVIEMNNIRNVLYNIKINQEELRVENVEQEKQMVYKPRLTLQQAGFSSYASLFLLVLFFADVLVIALWIIKALFK